MALKKMSIVAYSDKEFSSEVGKYDVLINPDTYTHNYTIQYNDATGQGKNGTFTVFRRMGEETVSFTITFDGTGVVPGAPAEGGTSSIKQQIDSFRTLVFAYNGQKHRPNFVKLLWGTLLFKCQLKTLSLKYTLFTPEGEPVRAEADVLFAGYNSAADLEKDANKSSPDMSHLVTVKAGDTLPLLCYRIYGTSVPYAEVARVNRLGGFRRIEPGTQLLFPPMRSSPA
jgi:contractile injection system tube protein